jgi:hypothetical protein
MGERIKREGKSESKVMTGDGDVHKMGGQGGRRDRGDREGRRGQGGDRGDREGRGGQGVGLKRFLGRWCGRGGHIVRK